MEKLGIDDEALLENLRNEEADLMREKGKFMTFGAKTASEQKKDKEIDERLGSVRAKITELDLKNANKDG